MPFPSYSFSAPVTPEVSWKYKYYLETSLKKLLLILGVDLQPFLSPLPQFLGVYKLFYTTSSFVTFLMGSGQNTIQLSGSSKCSELTKPDQVWEKPKGV